METHSICIRNMVCPRCVKAVKGLLDDLGIEFEDVVLGHATIKSPLSPEMLSRLREALEREGFELLDDLQSSEVENIRLSIIEWARMDGDRPALSEYLQNRCMKEYSSVSKLFSQMKSITVERYAMLQRIEYAKELISYGDKSISEISWSLGFSSPAHFSNQFKKETGISPKQFRQMHSKDRQFIDSI
ncbi:MAG: helix-turn-helix domain-containing protein [Bacteroidales bacterium]|nr:helix-turn-helix domain-containing protein [Bacteroidales bacterium]